MHSTALQRLQNLGLHTASAPATPAGTAANEQISLKEVSARLSEQVELYDKLAEDHKKLQAAHVTAMEKQRSLQQELNDVCLVTAWSQVERVAILTAHLGPRCFGEAEPQSKLRRAQYGRGG